MAGFELAVEDEGGIGKFFWREAEGGAKEDLGRPAPGQSHQAHAFLEVAVAGQEFESFFDEGFGIQRDEIGLVAVDALVVSGVERAGFFGGWSAWGQHVSFQKHPLKTWIRLLSTDGECRLCD